MEPTPATDSQPTPGSEFVLLRERLGGESRRFLAAHAAALLAYPGTLWHRLEEAVDRAEQAVQGEVHQLAQDVADWSAPAPAQQPAEHPTPPPAGESGGSVSVFNA